MSRLALLVPLSALSLSALSLAGCADYGAPYPSLLPRAIETRSDAESSAAQAPPAPDPALDSAIAALDRRLAATATGFAQEQARAAPVIRAAEGAAAGSNAWLDAQNAIGAVSSFEAKALAILADAEQLATARAQRGLSSYQPLDDVVARAAEQAQAQSTAVSAMAAALAPPLP